MAEGGYTISEYQGGYSSLDPNKAYSNNFTGYRATAGSLGITTDPRSANVIKEVSGKLSSGIKQIEAVLMSPTLDMVPKGQLEEVGQLAKLTGIDMSVHGPVVDVAGLTQQGFDEYNRQASERTLINSLERSHEIDPNGNINVTFHTSEGLPGSEWKTLGDVKGEKPREFKKMIVVDRTTGQMVNAATEEPLFTPGGEKGVMPKTKTPEERLEMMNGSRWDDDVNKIIFQKEMGDRILQETYPAGRELYMAIQQDRDLFSKLPKQQQEVILNIKTADAHIQDTHQAIGSLFSKAYEYGDEEIQEKLRVIGKNFEKNLIGFKQEEIKTEEQKQKAMMNQMDLQNRSKALQLFAEDLRDINPNFFQPLEDFALEKSSQTFGNAAFKSYKKFGDKAPIISIENPPIGHALSTGEDLKNLVVESRKQFADQLIKEEGMNQKQANKTAEKFIGATWDVGHINMLRKQGFEKEDIIRESEKIRPYLKHVHLSDNFGMEHTELPMGMGNVPLKEIMGKLGKEGFEAKKIVEASSWWQHMQTNPLKESLEGLGSPMYEGATPATMSVGGMPYWNQSLGLYQGYSSGMEGAWLPGINYQTFGTYFSQLPTDLGGQAPGAQGSRMSGRPME